MEKENGECYKGCVGYLKLSIRGCRGPRKLKKKNCKGFQRLQLLQTFD